MLLQLHLGWAMEMAYPRKRPLHFTSLQMLCGGRAQIGTSPCCSHFPPTPIAGRRCCSGAGVG